MSQIDELQARIMAALDRIGQGVEARASQDGQGKAGAALALAEARANAAQAARAEAEARATAAEQARAGAEARADAAEQAKAEAEAQAEAAESAAAEAEERANLAEAARAAAAEEAQAAAPDAGDGMDATALREALEEEKLANAQLEARVKVLHERLEAREREAAASEPDQAEALRKLDADLQSLRKANNQLRESNAALRAAHEAGVAEPHLINKAMMAELEGLRAVRAADRDEVALVLAGIDRALTGAEDSNRTEDG